MIDAEAITKELEPAPKIVPNLTPAKFSISPDTIANLRKECAGLAEPDADREARRLALRTCATLRNKGDKERLAANADLQNVIKFNNNTWAILLAEIQDIERPLALAKKADDEREEKAAREIVERQDREKREKEEAERKAQQELIDKQMAEIKAERDKLAKEKAERDEKDRIEREGREAKEKAEREERERTERERQKQIADEQKAEAERLANERRKLEEAQAAARAETTRKEREHEAKVAEDNRKIEAERRAVEAEKREAERLRLAEETRKRVEAETKERLEREHKEAEERAAKEAERQRLAAARKAALAPDVDKIRELGRALATMTSAVMPEVKDDTAKAFIAGIKGKLRAIIGDCELFGKQP